MSQFLREDVTEDRSAYLGQSIFPSEFHTQFVMALKHHHVDMSIFATNPQRLEQMVGQAWAMPQIQHAWTNPDALQTALGHGYSNPDLTTALGDALFNPASNSDLLDGGLALLQESGRTLTRAQQNYSVRDPLVSSTEQVPNPFGRFTPVSGNDYGQRVDPNSISGGYGPVHMGVDYGTPEGTLIAAPFAGTVTVDRGIAGYGNRVTLKLDNGYSMVFGHVADGLAQGRVNPGQIIARSGANVGSSRGAVTLVEWRAPDGSFLNPHAVLDTIQAGTNFAKLEATLGAGIAGTGITHSIALDAEFPGARGLFAKYFGRQPTDSELMRIATSGGPNQDLKSMEDYARTLPSHIAGMAVGAYFDLRNEADKVSMTELGHLSTDGIVKELFDAGQAAPRDVQNWYNTHSPDQIAKATYNAIYAANQPHLASIYNETGFDPRLAMAQVGSGAAEAPVVTDQQTAADSLPVAPRANDSGRNQDAIPSRTPLDAALAKDWAAAATPDVTPAPPTPAGPRVTTRRGGPQ